MRRTRPDKPRRRGCPAGKERQCRDCRGGLRPPAPRPQRGYLATWLAKACIQSHGASANARTKAGNRPHGGKPPRRAKPAKPAPAAECAANDSRGRPILKVTGRILLFPHRVLGFGPQLRSNKYLSHRMRTARHPRVTRNGKATACISANHDLFGRRGHRHRVGRHLSARQPGARARLSGCGPSRQQSDPGARRIYPARCSRIRQCAAWRCAAPIRAIRKISTSRPGPRPPSRTAT